MKVLDHGSKPCSKCKVNPRPTKHSWCRSCLAADQVARRRANPEKYRSRGREQSQKYKVFRRAKLHELKNKPCMDCSGVFPPCVMQFDHRDPNTKVRSVATMIQSTWSWDKVLEEVAKCDLVCANCHAIRTWMGGK